MSIEQSMNKTSSGCHDNEIAISYLTSRQIAILTSGNLILMSANVITNTLVVYILMKTKQISNISCRLYLMLSMSDLFTGVFAQNVFIAVFYKPKCLVKTVSRFSSEFLTHLSGYTIGIIGVDRYMRIKFHANLRALWTIRVASTLICVGFFLALFQAVMITTGLILRRHQIVVPIYIGIDSIVISIIIFPQILTIQTSSSVQNQSSVRTFERINRKITKLSMRTMLLLWFFYTPHVMIIKPIRSSIRNQLNDNGKSILEFTNCMSIIFTYANSSANAVLFLTTNVKAKRYLKRFFTD